MNYPVDTCDECGTEVQLDEPAGLCYYTGRGCAPGGCDCGTSKETLCDDCEVEASGVGNGDPIAKVGDKITYAKDGTVGKAVVVTAHTETGNGKVSKIVYGFADDESGRQTGWCYHDQVITIIRRVQL